MPPVFDPGRPHGSITPPHRGARYEQGGHYFDVHGEHLWSSGQSAEEAPPAPDPAAPPAPPEPAGEDPAPEDGQGAPLDLGDGDGDADPGEAAGRADGDATGDPLDAMTKDELEEFAREHFGLDIDRRKGLPKLVEQVKRMRAARKEDFA